VSKWGLGCNESVGVSLTGLFHAAYVRGSAGMRRRACGCEGVCTSRLQRGRGGMGVDGTG